MIGAYGKGERPEINGSGKPDEAVIYFGNYTIPTQYIELYSFVIYNGKGLGTSPATNHIKIFNCEAYNCSDNGNFYLYHDDYYNPNPLYIEMYNIISHGGEDHGIKVEASGCTLINPDYALEKTNGKETCSEVFQSPLNHFRRCFPKAMFKM